MRSLLRLLPGFLALAAVATAAIPAAADIRKDFVALAGVNSPRSISSEEWESASFSLFQATDKNKDNFLDPAELASAGIAKEILATADENRDAKLSITEFMQVRRAIFRAADMDRDDLLTYFEFELLVLLGQTGWTDTNRNGRVEVSELKDALTQAFGKLDADHDGKLGKDEAAYMGASQWKLCDGNEDGSLTLEEYLRGYLLSLGAL